MAPSSNGSRVELLGLSKAFAERTVLHHLELSLEPGSFVAIIGRSGCGKSTLLRLISGLERSSEGGVLIDGVPLKSLNPASRMMFQDGRLLPWKTVIDNVGIGLRGDWKPRALDVLDAVGLKERAGDWISLLSGGQKQRVALAKALITRPRLLLLDEPLGALDALTRIEMQQLIEGLWSEHRFTTLLVTHDVEEAVALADRILVLKDGQVSQDIDNTIERPRHRGNPAFATLTEAILDNILENDPSRHKQGHPGRSPIADQRSSHVDQLELSEAN